MEKYKFNRKLKEGVLTGRIKGQASIIIDGVEKKARCHSRGKICGKGLPCLVSENNNRGSMRYTVEAVSYDNKDGKREWICIHPILLEQAVGFFLENHHMENMVGNCEHVNKMSTATAGMCRPDFQADDTWIEVRILEKNTRNPDGFNQGSLASSIRQVEKYCQQLSDMKETVERMILLLICQAGTEEEHVLFKGKINEEIKKAVENGMEIWNAEMQFDADGIELLSYQNITDKILGG